jgi:hypothetical protein
MISISNGINWSISVQKEEGKNDHKLLKNLKVIFKDNGKELKLFILFCGSNLLVIYCIKNSSL